MPDKNGFPIILLLRTSLPLLSPPLPSSPLLSLSLLVSCFVLFFFCFSFCFLPISTNKDWTTKGALLHLIIHTKSQGVMVTPKKCKFMQLCEHHFGVSSTLKRCSFTPTWCKFVFMSCNWSVTIHHNGADLSLF